VTVTPETDSGEEGDGNGRKRGILSPSDREYLRNPDDFSRQASHEREARIRERIENAILDFSLLYDNVGFIEKEVLEHSMSRRRVPKEPPIQNGVRDALALFLDWSAGDRVLSGIRPMNSLFDRVFEGAWERLAWRHRFMLHDVTIAVEAEEIPWRELQERAETGEELTVEEQARLLLARRDELDSSETQERLQSVLVDGEDDGE